MLLKSTSAAIQLVLDNDSSTHEECSSTLQLVLTAGYVKYVLQEAIVAPGSPPFPLGIGAVHRRLAQSESMHGQFEGMNHHTQNVLVALSRSVRSRSYLRPREPGLSVQIFVFCLC